MTYTPTDPYYNPPRDVAPPAKADAAEALDALNRLYAIAENAIGTMPDLIADYQKVKAALSQLKS